MSFNFRTKHERFVECPGDGSDAASAPLPNPSSRLGDISLRLTTAVDCALMRRGTGQPPGPIGIYPGLIW